MKTAKQQNELFPGNGVIPNLPKKEKNAKQEVSANTETKHTAVGRVPVDWQVKQFKDIFQFHPSYSFSRENLTYEKTESEVFNIHYGDIHATFENEILDANIEKLPAVKDECILKQDFCFLEDGDLIIADASEDYEGVGECIEMKNVAGRKIIGGLHTFVARDVSNLTAKGFRTYIFRNSEARIELKKIATGSSVYGISKHNVLSLKILLPPLAEQQKIAEILNSWDSAIETTEKLISAKEQLKKGLMQQLLTGKKRFQSNTNKGTKWEHVSLEEVCYKPTYGYTASSVAHPIKNEKDHIYKFLRITDIQDDTVEWQQVPYCVSKEKLPDRYLLETGDIVIARIGSTTGKAYYIEQAMPDTVFASYLIRVRANPRRLHANFFRYIVSSVEYWRYIDEQKSGIKVGVNIPILNGLSFLLPPLEEQQKIASVLSACDREIQTLKARLSALKKQKKGLMQLLLTGHVRVKTEK